MTESVLEGTETEVGSLDGPTPIEETKQLEVETARTVAKRAVLAYLDAPEWMGKRVTWVDNPVHVVDTDCKWVGHAMIYIEGGQLIADMFFDYATPDRLTIETQAFPIWALPGGLSGNGFMYITMVCLSKIQPDDTRLTSLT